MKNKTFEDILKYRRSVRIFDPEKNIPTEDISHCIEQATLAPNSSNLQLWEFYQVISPEKRAELAHACLGQSAAKTAKEFVVFVVRKDLWKDRAQANKRFLEANFAKQANRHPKQEKMALNYYGKLIPTLYSDFFGMGGLLKRLFATLKGLRQPMYRQVLAGDMRVVAHKSTALAAQTFMLAMAAKGYDTCPMEGFDSLRVKSILGLPKSAEINMVVSCGIREQRGIYGPQFRIPLSEVHYKI